MATSILDPGLTAANSTDIVVADGAKVLLSIFTDTGGDMPSGPVLSLQRADINGNFINVSTVGYGRITFTWGCQQLTLDTPGTYRVSRPDITVWGVGVGVQSE